MAKDRDRYERSQRYEIVLDNGEDERKWSSLSDNTGTIVSGTAHVTGAQSISFDKVAGSWEDAYIVRPISQMHGSDLDPFSSEGQILSSVYFPSLTDVSSYNVALLMASGTDHGAYYSVADTDLSVGWNHIKMDCNSYTTVSGHGVNWKEVKWLGVGVSFDAASDTLSDIKLDSVRLQVPTSTYKFDPNIDNITVTAGTEIAIKNGDAADELSVDAADTARTSSTNVIPVQPIDSSGNIISGGTGTSGGLTLYSSPVHFTAVFQAATALDLSGMPFSISNFSQFVDIEAWDASAGFIEKYTPKTHVFSWDSVNDRVTVTGASFVTGGTYKVSILAEDRTVSIPTDSQKVTVLNPQSQEYSFETVADVTSEADASSDYYVSLDGTRNLIIQYEKTGGSDVCGLTVWGTLLSDGTPADSCDYQDISQYGLDPLTHSTASGIYDSSTMLKTQDGSSYKYLMFRVSSDLSGSDGDYSIKVKRHY